MPQINQLPLMSSVSSGDQLPIYSSNNGDARRISVNALAEYIDSSNPSLVTNIYTPTTGFTISAPINQQQWLLLIPTWAVNPESPPTTTGTITLPLNTSTADGSEILVTTTKAVTTLTVAANGATSVNGAPTTLAANGSFRLRFVQAYNSWYRIS